MRDTDRIAGRKRKYGVVGGLGAIGAADVLLKMVRAAQGSVSGRALDVAFEQRHFEENSPVADLAYDPTRRKFHVYGALKDMESRGIDTALVPCFVSHTFLGEIQPAVGLRVVDMFDALREHIARHHPGVKTIGVLASTYVVASGVFERRLGQSTRIVYPSALVQAENVMAAVYGPGGIREGIGGGECVHLLFEACASLIDMGAEIIVPGMTEVPTLIEALRPLVPIPLVDSNQVYAQYALGCSADPPPREFKLGVVGGVGPAATVDFMRKVVRLTRAARDQDHIKMVVEQNPQIPDRTANLIGSGQDPTIALLATCKRLEADDADAVAIPCNTAHAFVDRIQPYLGIPVVNMLSEVVQHIRSQLPQARQVGLLATSGTLASGVYRDILQGSGMAVVTPEPEIQDRVMQAIYGDQGVKAGFTSGQCSAHLEAAIAHLLDKGAQVIVLGCTELPLIELEPSIRRSTMLLDPTEILAQRCVSLARRG